MREKNKSNEVDLLYVKKNNKKKKVAGKKKPANHNDKKDANKLFNFDDEIVIGVNKVEDKPKKNKKSKKNARKPIKKKPSKLKTFLKFFVIIVFIIGIILFLLLSPTFNITTITINGNEKISDEEIKSLSQIYLNENTFKFRCSEIIQNIKTQPYIDSVSVTRKLPNEIIINVVERKPQFAIQIGNAFVYMSSQGYFLEVANDNSNLPLIEGYNTIVENITPGNRLINEDLERLETVLKIMKCAKTNEIENKITYIDMSDKNEYIIKLENEKKIVYLGDASYIEKKMQYLLEVLNNIPDVEAEIFLNVDINNENFYVREKV